MNPSGFYDVAQTVLDCVCDQMTALAGEEGVPDNYGCPCLTYVSAGEPAIDCCSIQCTSTIDGMLTVHIENVFASDSFPTPTSGFEPCKAQTWVVSLVVTAARCAKTMDDEGNLPTVEELNGYALLMAVDQYAIMTALGCCVVESGIGAKRKRRVQIQESRPLVSEGGCASVEVRAFIEAGQVCACGASGS